MNLQEFLEDTVTQMCELAASKTAEFAQTPDDASATTRVFMQLEQRLLNEVREWLEEQEHDILH